MATGSNMKIPTKDPNIVKQLSYPGEPSLTAIQFTKNLTRIADSYGADWDDCRKVLQLVLTGPVADWFDAYKSDFTDLASFLERFRFDYIGPNYKAQIFYEFNNRHQVPGESVSQYVAIKKAAYNESGYHLQVGEILECIWYGLLPQYKWIQPDAPTTWKQCDDYVKKLQRASQQDIATLPPNPAHFQLLGESFPSGYRQSFEEEQSRGAQSRGHENQSRPVNSQGSETVNRTRTR